MTTDKTVYQQWSPGSKRVLAALSRLLSELGAGSGVLACVGSWGDTLADNELAEMTEELLEDKCLKQIKRFALERLLKDMDIDVERRLNVRGLRLCPTHKEVMQYCNQCVDNLDPTDD